MLFRVAMLVLISIVCFGASPQTNNSEPGNRPSTFPVRLAKLNIAWMRLEFSAN